ncbi:MAG: FG-GAP-like repeat-containing protein, partial [Verrucomicrobiales bacterium]
KSNDLQTHLTDPDSPDGFELPRQLYATGADPAGLAIADLDGNGRGEVIQLHRAAGDISVRHAEADGSLSAPVYYPMGINSNGLTVSDLNGDGVADVSVANLGRGSGGGNLGIRHGDGTGGFGELITITPPTNPDPDPGSGPLAPGVFALVQADVDGDGIEDQIVGYFDCRVTFFCGVGDGSYEAKMTTTFVYESRLMVAGDFDQDGDIDIAGAGATGEGVVLINNGDFFTNPNPERFSFYVGDGGKGNARSAVVRDLNDDGDDDIVIATASGLFTLIGGEGASFLSAGIIGGGNPASSIAGGDFDNDGPLDFAVACEENSRLQVYSGQAGGLYGLSLDLDVPSASYIAAGDIDGDGLVDLAGTGSVLWTALSGSSPPPSQIDETARAGISGVLINEILPKNDSFGIESDGNRSSDAVEVINASEQAIDLQGWKLRLIKLDGETSDHTISEPLPVSPGARVVFVCRKGDSPLHTGYKLPAEGGEVVLLDALAAPVDQVEYPEIEADISLARYGDANATFYFNSYPDIGSQNLDNGLISPDLKFLGISPPSPSADEPLQFRVRARDDVGIALLGIAWKRLDTTSEVTGWVPLYDDGMHGDGGMLDGEFAGTLESGFPDGAEIEFYVQGFDLSDAIQTLPGSAMFSIREFPIRNFSMAIGSANDVGGGLQVSEVVPSNDGSIVDESGEAADWIELRNTGEAPVSLDGFGLAQLTSPAPDEIMPFPDGMVLGAGDYLIIWADNDLDQGPLHAPFRLSAGGEAVYLVSNTELGATAIAGGLVWPDMESGRAFAAIGGPRAGIERIQQPTPREQNLPGGRLEIIPRSEDGNFRFAYPTGRG